MSMEILIIAVVLAIGIGLLLLETFFIPGFGIPGVLGIVLCIGGVMYAFSSLGAKGGTFVLCIALLVSAASFIGLIKSKALDKLALKTNITATVSDDNKSKIMVGDQGICLSRLNPMGRVQINGEIVEAKLESGFLDENTPIEVIQINSTNITVKPLS